jgi:hypothetical protein
MDADTDHGQQQHRRHHIRPADVDADKREELAAAERALLG